MTIQLDLVQTGGLAMLVLFAGRFLNRKIAFLSRNNIPEPVVGGMVFAFLTWFLFASYGVEFTYDMSLKGPLMLTFFTTVGLGASFKLLQQGGPKVLLFLVLTSVYLMIQNTVGISVAWLTDMHPLFGLLGGSITLAGGHGTGATYAGIFAKSQNLQASMELAMACATFGLVLGGIIGGPVAKRLITLHNLKPTHQDDSPTRAETITFDPEDEDHVTPMKMMETMLIIAICIVLGGVIFQYLKAQGIAAPSFICALGVGIVITNLCEWTGIYKIHKESVDLCGTIGLSIFLSMALMSLRLWELMNLAGPMLILLMVQTTTLAAFAYFVTFRVMGKTYDAAIMAGGHCGFGMGATPTAVANMESLTARFGASPEAFLVVPMVGAFFIDITNAFTITLFLGLLGY